ncbi:MAG TPA: discoidin domain-containing protein [Butyricimonas virosa]|uniref:Discoidin domain-containing protein n=1 Tax=Butyricimonas virosa TaxID=544645 RepID=A0A921H217_9BACT|nr:discoidin domain-containing protein [Butyricimonas virosa]
MERKLYYIAWLLAALFAISCEDLEETYDEYAGDGMVRYIGKCSEVEVQPGWERLRVSWKNNLDAAVKRVKISWQSEEDSKPFVRYIDRQEIENNASLMDTIYIENLKDVVYTVRVSSLSADSTESLVEEKYGRPYSESHEDLRSFTRGIINFYRLGDRLAVCVDENNENLKELILTYQDTRGQLQEWNIKDHMDDTLSMESWTGSYPICRDYMFLLPEEEGVGIDFSQALTIKRRGLLTGCIDEIDFKDEVLDLNERIWSTAFSQLMVRNYGTGWENEVDRIETLELDYNMPALQDLMYFPNLKKVILGKNRYMAGKYATSHASTTDEYVGLTTLQFLMDTREGFTVERYNEHYFGMDNMLGMDCIMLYQMLGKLKSDFSLTEMGTSNLDNTPSITSLDTEGWVVTCSDTVYNGYKENGAAWLLDDDANTYFEPGQTLGASVIEVTFDMKKEQVVHGFKVMQYPRNDRGDQNYLLSSIKIEFSNDGYIWRLATNEDGAITIGNAPGEVTYINIPEDKQNAVRYVRLSMGNQQVSTVSGSALFNLRLGSCMPY